MWFGIYKKIYTKWLVINFWTILPSILLLVQYLQCIYITLCVIFMILVSLENVKKYSHVVAWLPQRLKSTFIEIFSSGGPPKGTWSEEKISKNVDYSLWGNRATTQIHIWNWIFFPRFSSLCARHRIFDTNLKQCALHAPLEHCTNNNIKDDDAEEINLVLCLL